jgi:hypothetical protein
VMLTSAVIVFRLFPRERVAFEQPKIDEPA